MSEKNEILIKELLRDQFGPFLPLMADDVTNGYTMMTDQLHADADDLLAESGLLDLLAPHGQVQLTGSYRYQLMTVPDSGKLISGASPIRPAISPSTRSWPTSLPNNAKLS